MIGLGATIMIPLLVAGCNQKSKPSAQTVATVNDGEITVSEMQLELGSSPPDQQKLAQPIVLQTLLDRKVLAQYARENNIDKNPEFLLQVRRMTEIMLAERAAKQVSASAQRPITTSDVNRYLDEHPGMGIDHKIITVDQLAFSEPSSAAAQKFLGAKTMDDVISILNEHGIKFSRSQVKIDTGSLRNDLIKRLEALPPGEPLVILNTPNSTANLVVGVESAPINGSDAVNLAKRAIAVERGNEAIQKLGLSLRKNAKVTYSKGYEPKVSSNAKPEKRQGS